MTEHWDDDEGYYENIIDDLEREIERDLIAIEAQYQLKEFDPIAYEKVKTLLLKYKVMCDA
jgi:hypothetical protein